MVLQMTCSKSCFSGTGLETIHNTKKYWKAFAKIQGKNLDLQFFFVITGIFAEQV